jgi:hypothetical protein
VRAVSEGQLPMICVITGVPTEATGDFRQRTRWEDSRAKEIVLWWVLGWFALVLFRWQSILVTSGWSFGGCVALFLIESGDTFLVNLPVDKLACARLNSVLQRALILRFTTFGLAIGTMVSIMAKFGAIFSDGLFLALLISFTLWISVQSQVHSTYPKAVRLRVGKSEPRLRINPVHKTFVLALDQAKRQVRS